MSLGEILEGLLEAGVDFEDFVPGEVEKVGEHHLTQEEIIEFGRKWDPQSFHIDAMESMERLSLLKRVEAAIIKANMHLQELDIEVPEPGVVKLSGMIEPLHTAAGVSEVIKQVSGVKQVISEAQRHPLPEL